MNPSVVVWVDVPNKQTYLLLCGRINSPVVVGGDGMDVPCGTCVSESGGTPSLVLLCLPVVVWGDVPRGTGASESGGRPLLSSFV
jgi:hypothetical protein